ncbi:hypothetical protein BANRA_05503 [Escherichia coli]|nr:hypothetical protein BANRA_05503 [Escherichia coli]
MVIRDRLKCCQRVSGAFFGIMVGSGAPGTRFSQTLLKTQERVKTHTGAILVCLLLLCFASIARSRSFPELLFSAPVPVFFASESMKNPFQLSLAGNSCVIHMAA